MIVTREGIHKKYQLEPRGGIHELIDAGKEVAIFEIGSIQVSIIDVYPPLLVGLLDEDDIYEPLRIVYLMNEVNFDKLGDLVLYSSGSLRGKLFSFASQGGSSGRR